MARFEFHIPMVAGPPRDMTPEAEAWWALVADRITSPPGEGVPLMAVVRPEEAGLATCLLADMGVPSADGVLIALRDEEAYAREEAEWEAQCVENAEARRRVAAERDLWLVKWTDADEDTVEGVFSTKALAEAWIGAVIDEFWELAASEREQMRATYRIAAVTLDPVPGPDRPLW